MENKDRFLRARLKNTMEVECWLKLDSMDFNKDPLMSTHLINKYKKEMLVSFKRKLEDFLVNIDMDNLQFEVVDKDSKENKV